MRLFYLDYSRNPFASDVAAAVGGVAAASPRTVIGLVAAAPVAADFVAAAAAAAAAAVAAVAAVADVYRTTPCCTASAT